MTLIMQTVTHVMPLHMSMLDMLPTGVGQAGQNFLGQVVQPMAQGMTHAIHSQPVIDHALMQLVNSAEKFARFLGDHASAKPLQTMVEQLRAQPWYTAAAEASKRAIDAEKAAATAGGGHGNLANQLGVIAHRVTSTRPLANALKQEAQHLPNLPTLQESSTVGLA